MFIPNIILLLFRNLFPILILMYPFAPIFYGWVTRDKIGSIIIGIAPTIIIFYYMIFVLGGVAPSERIIFFIQSIILAIIGGFEGYFASKGIREGLMIAILLYILWILIYVSLIFD